MQEDDPLGEPPLNTGLVTGLLIAGMLGNGVMGQIHPALMLLTEPLIIIGFVIAQATLNAHWERHAAGAVPGQRVAQPLAAAAAAPRELARLLGVRAPQVEWGAGAAFLVATVLADLVFLLLVPLLRHETVLPLYSSMMSLTADLLLTVAAVAYFHWIRNDAGAAALAAIGYSLLQVVSSLVMAEILLGEHSLPAAQSVLRLAYSFLANFLFLLYLALAVRFVRPVWLGLWLGATAAQLASSVVYRVVGTFLSMRLRGQSSSLFHIDPWDVATDLLFAAVFAFAFWGGLSLMAPRVLQQR